MRKKELRLVVTFQTTTQAMAMETACRAGQIAGRLIPLPASIAAGCGLAWMSAWEQRQVLQEYMEEQNLKYQQIYEIVF